MNNKLTSVSFRKDFQKPEEEKDRSMGFVKWGKKNDYPFFLVDLYNGSAYHQGIIKNKTHYIAGGGVEIVNGLVQPFIDNKWSDFDMNEIAERMAFDQELFGGMAVKGTWNKEQTKVVMWEHIPLDMIRTSVDERTYYISDDWTALNQSPEKTNLRILPAFDKDNRTGSFILYYKEPHLKGRKELGVYPKPSYYGGITAIQTDCDISKFHMYELQNGFKSGTLINFPSGYPETTEELNRIKADVKGRSQSVEDAGEIILTFSNGKDETPTVLSLNGNNLDQRYLATEKSVQQNILVAHAITSPQLFGVRLEGSFNSAESDDLFNIFKSTYVNTKQKRIEWLLNLMLELGGYVGKVKLHDVEPLPKDASQAEQAPTTEGQPAPEAVDVAKSALNGAQIASLIDVVAKIKEGILTPQSALSIVLASFPTIDERTAREIVGVPPTALSMCKHDSFSTDEIKVFEQFGESNDNFIVLHSEPIAWDTPSAEVFARSQQLFDKVGEISAVLTGGDKDVLKLLADGESSDAIAKALNTSVEEVAKRIQAIRDLNLLTKEGDVNTLGKNVIDNVEIPVSRFQVRYTYRTRPNVPDPKTQSREFCVKLIELNRSYSRQDIDTISTRVDRDVWKYRGGWYTNPDTGATTPFCRHEWIQQLVIAQ
jgi:predicted small secreted protein